jgi:hypothetical protein
MIEHMRRQIILFKILSVCDGISFFFKWFFYYLMTPVENPAESEDIFRTSQFQTLELPLYSQYIIKPAIRTVYV